MKASQFFASRFACAMLAATPFLASCGGTGPAATTPATTTAKQGAAQAAATGSAPGPATAAVAWHDMNRDQRASYMKTVVLPKMSATFQTLNAERYKDMSCATCHGPGAKDHSFKMPNPALPKLSVEGGFKKHREQTPAVTTFMMNEVVPQMASLLGEQPYDPKTQKGFGCFECHTMEK